MPAPDVTALERSLNSERARFNVARHELARLLGDGPADDLLGCAAEYGMEQALKDARDAPARLGLATSPGVNALAALSSPLATAYHASARMDEIVFERESLLMAADPAHRQVLIHLGREFVFDLDKGLARWLDGAPPSQLDVVRVGDHNGDHHPDDDRRM